ncbi:hypothetical protein ACIBI9_32955 [Nonomuraea sp. NPDC050451]|uniref:hypothetical protein n=1 Tax=Nonomuraea sp. NPDC050451 TaxID=3364364 RepID=UPI0037B00CD4
MGGSFRHRDGEPPLLGLEVDELYSLRLALEQLAYERAATADGPDSRWDPAREAIRTMQDAAATPPHLLGAVRAVDPARLDLQRSVMEHVTLLEHAVKGDVDAGLRELREHLTRARQVMMRSVQSQREGGESVE